ncbi:Transcriptional regulatory protein DegU [Defluviimonas aquaemixtae]|uniref:Transcriptional regulatory protein DegU n=1 Tax=Albidovulum aquaemixtae TaxID=1542388 RepID=A0A2R8BNZ3_9RHOB|nr:response regulator transcription factor [Defluviimonas aquaemixtae]SPH25147.1 Transcriptional regulatory protein DegU [Defluviimonas aquaemixtae]
MTRNEAAAHAVPLRSALVVDDHPLYCDALASMMETVFGMRRVRKAASLDEALKILRARFAPDLVMLDLKLPDVSDLSGFMKIKGKAPDVPVIVISAITSAEVVRSVMEAGAAGFIPKDAGRDTLRDAIRDIWDGKTYLPPGYEVATKRREGDPSFAEISRKIAGLSQQQSRILSLICKGKPNKLIAYEMQLAEATVKAHITALLRRLGVQNRTQAALMVREASIRHHLQ